MSAWRVVGVLLAPVLAFGCAVMFVAMSDIGGTPTCEELAGGELRPASASAAPPFRRRSPSASVGTSGAIAGLAALAALAFVITGRRGRLALQLAALAVVLGGLSILIVNV